MFILRVTVKIGVLLGFVKEPINCHNLGRLDSMFYEMLAHLWQQWNDFIQLLNYYKIQKNLKCFNASMTIGLGSRISGFSFSISSSTYGVDKITSSQPSSKVSKVGMSSIIVSSSTSIPIALANGTSLLDLELVDHLVLVLLHFRLNLPFESNF